MAVLKKELGILTKNSIENSCFLLCKYRTETCKQLLNQFEVITFLSYKLYANCKIFHCLTLWQANWSEVCLKGVLILLILCALLIRQSMATFRVIHKRLSRAKKWRFSCHILTSPVRDCEDLWGLAQGSVVVRVRVFRVCWKVEA